MLFMQVNKKNLKYVINLIKSHDSTAFIIASDTKYVQNGLVK